MSVDALLHDLTDIANSPIEARLRTLFDVYDENGKEYLFRNWSISPTPAFIVNALSLQQLEFPLKFVHGDHRLHYNRHHSLW